MVLKFSSLTILFEKDDNFPYPIKISNKFWLHSGNRRQFTNLQVTKCSFQLFLIAQRLQLASVYKGEAEKILQVKRAEADAEAKYLGGVGVARQRQAITDGLRENILNFSHKVEGTSAKEVMDLIMITQYFDTIKDLGNSSKNTTVFIPHGPGHVRDIGDQIRNGLMEASSAQIPHE